MNFFKKILKFSFTLNIINRSSTFEQLKYNINILNKKNGVFHQNLGQGGSTRGLRSLFLASLKLI